MKRTALITALILTAMIGFYGCGGGGSDSGIASSISDAQYGSIKGQLKGEEIAGLFVVAEPVVDGMAASVRAALGPKRLAGDYARLTSVSNSDGEYVFENVPIADYTIDVYKSNRKVGGGHKVSVRNNSPVNVDIQITPTINITGRVELENRGYMAGITLYLAGTSYMAMTGPNGFFQISDVPAVGSYEIRNAMFPGYQTKTAEITITSRDNIILPLITLLEGSPVTDSSRVYGTITDGVNPIAGAEVLFWYRNILKYVVMTDSNGQISFKIPPATYKIEIDADGFQMYSEIRDIASNTPQNLNVALSPYTMNASSVFIGGFVRWGRYPVENASVRLFDQADSLVAGPVATMDDGAFSFSSISQGTYYLQVDKVGYEQFKTQMFNFASDMPMLTLPILSAPIGLTITQLPGLFPNGVLSNLNEFLWVRYDNGQTEFPLPGKCTWSVTNGNGNVSFNIPNRNWDYTAPPSSCIANLECTYTEAGISVSANTDVIVSTYVYMPFSYWILALNSNFVAVPGIQDPIVASFEPVPSLPVNDMVSTPNGLLVYSSHDNGITRFNVVTGNTTEVYEGQVTSNTALDTSANLYYSVFDGTDSEIIKKTGPALSALASYDLPQQYENVNDIVYTETGTNPELFVAIGNGTNGNSIVRLAPDLTSPNVLNLGMGPATEPKILAPHPSASKLYVMFSSSQEVRVIDVDSNSFLAEKITFPAQFVPQIMAITPGGNNLFFASATYGKVAVVPTNDLSNVTVIPGYIFSGGSIFKDVTFSENGEYIFLRTTTVIYVLNSADLGIVQEIPLYYWSP